MCWFGYFYFCVVFGVIINYIENFIVVDFMEIDVNYNGMFDCFF